MKVIIISMLSFIIPLVSYADLNYHYLVKLTNSAPVPVLFKFDNTASGNHGFVHVKGHGHYQWKLEPGQSTSFDVHEFGVSESDTGNFKLSAFFQAPGAEGKLLDFHMATIDLFGHYNDYMSGDTMYLYYSPDDSLSSYYVDTRGYNPSFWGYGYFAGTAFNRFHDTGNTEIELKGTVNESDNWKYPININFCTNGGESKPTKDQMKMILTYYKEAESSISAKKELI